MMAKTRHNVTSTSRVQKMMTQRDIPVVTIAVMEDQQLNAGRSMVTLGSAKCRRIPTFYYLADSRSINYMVDVSPPILNRAGNLRRTFWIAALFERVEVVRGAIGRPTVIHLRVPWFETATSREFKGDPGGNTAAGTRTGMWRICCAHSPEGGKIRVRICRRPARITTHG